MKEEVVSRSTEGVRFVCEFEVTDAVKFKELVDQCVAISRQEPGTLVYDWYLDQERGIARLYEAYKSVDAVRAHVSGRVFTEVGPKMLEVCRFTNIDAYGDLREMQGEPEFAPTTWWGPAFSGLTTQSG
jgi:quinol monooxygenase YgiN